MVKHCMRDSDCASRARFPGQNNTSSGSSDSELMAFAVMAWICCSTSATTIATPVAKSAMVSRKARASSCQGLFLVTTLLHELAHSFGVLLDLRVVAGHERACHPHRVPEEEALVEHLARAE